MPFGLPCPEEMDPPKVFSLIEEFDQVLAAVVAEIEKYLSEAIGSMGQAVAASTRTLQTWTQSQLTRITRAVGDVWDVLRSNLNSQQFVLSSQLYTTVSEISNLLQTTEQEVLYGPSPNALPGTPFPVSSSPYDVSGPLPVVPGFPPRTQPDALPAAILPQSPQAVSVPLIVGGQTVPVAMICNPVPGGSIVTAGGFDYRPIFRVFLSTGTVRVDANGNPSVGLAYDKQPDGSIAVHFGPITVQMSLQSSNPAAPPIECSPQIG